MFRVRGAIVLIAVSLLGSWAAHGANVDPFAYKVGQHGFIDGDWWICRSYELFQKFKHLLSEDNEAAMKLVQRECTGVRDQTEVVIEDTNAFRLNPWARPRALCVRPVGEPDCGWLLSGFVTSEPCATKWREGCAPRRDAAGRLMGPRP